MIHSSFLAYFLARLGALVVLTDGVFGALDVGALAISIIRAGREGAYNVKDVVCDHTFQLMAGMEYCEVWDITSNQLSFPSALAKKKH